MENFICLRQQSGLFHGFMKCFTDCLCITCLLADRDSLQAERGQTAGANGNRNELSAAEDEKKSATLRPEDGVWR